MSFREELQKLSVQIVERKKHITNEEMTKQSLIIPFLQVLGYDVFNPLEVKSEYISDFGKKKGGKKLTMQCLKITSPLFSLRPRQLLKI
jgi:hypothetical protein